MVGEEVDVWCVGCPVLKTCDREGVFVITCKNYSERKNQERLRGVRYRHFLQERERERVEGGE